MKGLLIAHKHIDAELIRMFIIWGEMNPDNVALFYAACGETLPPSFAELMHYMRLVRYARKLIARLAEMNKLLLLNIIILPNLLSLLLRATIYIRVRLTQISA